MNIALIDNYDSFTYNLAHLVRELGATVQVFRNDRFRMEDIEPFDHILLSPGPGIPSEAGLLLPCIRHFAGRRPILGVCLGHQAIGEAFGARLTNLIMVGRYHSWVVDAASMPDCLEPTSVSDEGYVMSLRHREMNIRGIQYHPESVLTPEGRTIIANWLNQTA